MKPILKLVTPNQETKPVYSVGDPVTANFKEGGSASGMVVKVVTSTTGKTGYVVALISAEELPEIAGRQGVAMGMGVFEADFLKPRWQTVN